MVIYWFVQYLAETWQEELHTCMCASSRICELCRSGIIGPLCNSDLEHSGHLKHALRRWCGDWIQHWFAKLNTLHPSIIRIGEFGVVYGGRPWSTFAGHRLCTCLGMCNPNSQTMLWLCLHIYLIQWQTGIVHWINILWVVEWCQLFAIDTSAGVVP